MQIHASTANLFIVFDNTSIGIFSYPKFYYVLSESEALKSLNIYFVVNNYMQNYLTKLYVIEEKFYIINLCKSFLYFFLIFH